MNDIEGLGMEDVKRLEHKFELLDKLNDVKAEVREVKSDLRAKADRDEISKVYADIGRKEQDHAERWRSIKSSVDAVETAVKALAEMVAQETGGKAPRRFSMRSVDPRILLAAGLAGGAAVGKSAEILVPLILTGGGL